MPTPTSNISLGDLQSEMGGSNPISMSEYYSGGGIIPSNEPGEGGTIPSSGQIKLGTFRNIAGSSFFNTTYSWGGTTNKYWFHRYWLQAISTGTPNQLYSNFKNVYSTANGTTTVPEWAAGKAEYARSSISPGGVWDTHELTDRGWSAPGEDDHTFRPMEIRQFRVPNNASYCIVEGWGAGGGAAYGWFNMGGNGGGGGYCRSYLYMGSHMNAGDIITLVPGIAGIAGHWLGSGTGGGASICFKANDYYDQWETSPGVSVMTSGTANSTMDTNKRSSVGASLSTSYFNGEPDGTNLIFCAGGGGGGGAYNWSYQSQAHAGGGGQNGSNGNLSVSTAQAGSKTSHASGQMNAVSGSRSGSYHGSESNWTSTSNNTDHLIDGGYHFERLLFPQHPILVGYTSSALNSYYAWASSAGGGAWGSNGGNVGLASSASYAGSRGAAGGSVGVYQGQSTLEYNGSGTSPGTTGGTLQSLASGRAYGGTGQQYSSGNYKYGSSGQPGQVNIKFYS